MEIHDGFPGGKQKGIPIGCSCLNSWLNSCGFPGKTPSGNPDAIPNGIHGRILGPVKLFVKFLEKLRIQFLL